MSPTLSDPLSDSSDNAGDATPDLESQRAESDPELDAVTEHQHLGINSSTGNQPFALRRSKCQCTMGK